MKFLRATKSFLSLFCATAIAVGASACAQLDELKKPETSAFYGEAKPPQSNEFRWANGEAPKTLDPAKARTSAEMQAARAAFDGLTEWDAKTLRAVPAIAESWDASDDARTYTFHLRPNAVWSNNRKITAKDFVRAWRRLLEQSDNDERRALLANIVGAKRLIEKSKLESSATPAPTASPVAAENSEPKTNVEPAQTETELETKDAQPSLQDDEQRTKDKGQRTNNDFWFGVEAIDDQTLRVYLVEPDKDFALVAAHSALRPIFGDGGEFEKNEAVARIVVSGAFRFVENNKNGLLLERNPNYWNAAAVKLEKARFVPLKNPEAALAAYRAGEVDAVTNVQFEPLALKLLQSYKDFERTKFNAVAVYDFNRARKPFDDARVRRALAVAIDRERLSNDELDGANFAAATFLPDSNAEPLKFDQSAARALLAAAGFENGKDFPRIRLLVNRNDLQRRVARAIAAQWRKNLNVETEIVTSSLDETDAETIEDFDLTRRTIVLPTPAETANLRLIFGAEKNASAAQILNEPQPNPSAAPNSAEPVATPLSSPSAPTTENNAPAPVAQNQVAPLSNDAAPNNELKDLIAQVDEFEQNANAAFADETAALAELPAIPLYFPSSYALVKPYVAGFDANPLDAPSLKDVSIEIDWRAAPPQ